MMTPGLTVAVPLVSCSALLASGGGDRRPNGPGPPHQVDEPRPRRAVCETHRAGGRPVPLTPAPRPPRPKARRRTRPRDRAKPPHARHALIVAGNDDLRHDLERGENADATPDREHHGDRETVAALTGTARRAEPSIGSRPPASQRTGLLTQTG